MKRGRLACLFFFLLALSACRRVKNADVDTETTETVGSDSEDGPVENGTEAGETDCDGSDMDSETDSKDTAAPGTDSETSGIEPDSDSAADSDGSYVPWEWECPEVVDASCLTDRGNSLPRVVR